MNTSDLQNKTRPFTISLPARIDERSKILAAKLGVSRSQLIAALLDMADGNQPQTPEAKIVMKMLLEENEVFRIDMNDLCVRVAERLKLNQYKDLGVEGAAKKLTESRRGTGPRQAAKGAAS